jgi:hypothetical protein
MGLSWCHVAVSIRVFHEILGCLNAFFMGLFTTRTLEKFEASAALQYLVVGPCRMVRLHLQP